MTAWQQQLAEGFSNSSTLLEYLGLDPNLADPQAEQSFATRVPKHFADLMTPSIDDPLLRQVWAQGAENLQAPGYSDDPLQEQHAAAPGLLHKYQSRVLLILRGGCAINCRYCFRRAFPYAELTLTQRAMQASLDYIQAHPEVNEVILSGGDPLMADDKAISGLLDQLEAIAHLRRIRIHTRLPVVIPDRLTDALLVRLTQSRLKPVLVLHSNHAQEISPLLRERLQPYLRQMPVLNQSVLLAGVNDDVDTLSELSEALFDADIRPYYLFLLDRVNGAAHFEVDEREARALYQSLQSRLPGFLVPKLAREIPDRASKTLVV